MALDFAFIATTNHNHARTLNKPCARGRWERKVPDMGLRAANVPLFYESNVAFAIYLLALRHIVSEIVILTSFLSDKLFFKRALVFNLKSEF